MKLQNLTVIFIIIALPIILLVSLYINTGLKTIRYQALYDTGLLTATQDAIQAFETNTVNNNYSNNPEEKRNIIKSSIKMFETSLSNTCNISTYDLDDIESYIPAMVFGMYDGFYLYAPSLNSDGKYEHSLKNYVYYSELLDQENAVVIRYYLDSYVQISGYFNGVYESREGFLLNTESDAIKFVDKDGGNDIDKFYNEYQKILNDNNILTMPVGTPYNDPAGKIIYYGIEIDIQDEWAVNYFVDNYKFSKWFKENVINKYSSTYKHLDISNTNDPEDPNSEFAKHKKEVIRNKIEGVLNSTITAYSERTWGQNYKMPKLTEEEWERIYSDISVTTFFQGKRIGFTKYNGYCVLNCNNHYEFVNPNLLYFSEDFAGPSILAGGDYMKDPDTQINTSYDIYHDIRCINIPEENPSGAVVGIEEAPEYRAINTLRGWKIGRFKKVKLSETETGRGGTGPELAYKDYNEYMYERAECACYDCINGSVPTDKTVYEFVNIATDDCSDWKKRGRASEYLTISYWTSLARERATIHEKEPEPNFTVTKSVEKATIVNGGYNKYTITVKNNAAKKENIIITDEVSNDDTITITDITECKKGTTTYDAITKDMLQSSEGFKIELNQGEELKITYTAKVTDKSDDGTDVTNTVKATVLYEGETITKEATASCETIHSKLSIAKSVKQDNKLASTVEYESKVRYEIVITNEADVEDKINIKDVFFNNQITSVENITIARTIKIENIGKGTEISETVKSDDGTQIGNTSRNWENISIAPNEIIVIGYDAILKGEIGKNIINTAMVQSVLTGETKWDKATTICKTEKTIKMQGSGGGDYHVILVLDASLSMAGRIGEAKAAAEELIKIIGKEKVTIITFAQSASVKDSIGQYNLITNGISTNYVGGLSVARNNLKSGVNNYIVFMSDGGPTNTQGTDKHWSWEDGNILEKIGDMIGDLGEGFLAAILGGWIELNWTGENEYNVRLLVGNMAEGIIEGIIRLISLPYKLLTGNWGASDQDIINFAIGDIGLAKSVWQNTIMKYVNELKGLTITKQMYTVYFDTSVGGNYNDPIYGLAQMATSEDNAFSSNNAGDLLTIFKGIADEIKAFEIDTQDTTQNGVITLKLYKDISAIRVGSRMLTPSELAKVKSKIKDNGDKSGTLDLKDPEIAGMFKTKEEIVVMY